MQKPKDYSNLFLDMNAFFAKVEQQVQPQLRGIPVCVAPYTGDTGCCIAKSYEAKSFGVATGTSVGEAKKQCPQIVIQESRPELYLFYHKEIVKVLESVSPFMRVLSVDEFNIKLTGLDQNRKTSISMAKKIKQAISEKVGDYLTCSIGIGPNMWLAKVAGELRKPNGLVVLTLEELPALYRSLDLIDLPGINVGMKRQLRRKKIKTPFDFFQSSLFNLSRHYGHPGRVWYHRLRGFEVDDIKVATKSIGHQHVLAPKYRDWKLARRVLVKMINKCAERLRQKKLWAGGVSIYVRFLDKSVRQSPDGSRRPAGGTSWGKNTSVDLISDTKNIQRIALSLYDACKYKKPPIMVAVTLFNLKQVRGEQISLFSENEKSLKISKVLDRINNEFGPGTIIPASMFDTSDAAPDRIPFGPPATPEH